MKRFCLHAFAVMSLAVVATSDSQGAEYPDKSVRVIVGLAAGGGTDISARIIAQKLTETLGQSFIVDNRPGAGSMLGIELAAKAPPDGYTLIMVSPEFAVNPSLQAKVPYDPIRDFSPVVQVVYSQYFLSVRNALPATSVRELIALAKARAAGVANARALTYASSGNGSQNRWAR